MRCFHKFFSLVEFFSDKRKMWCGRCLNSQEGIKKKNSTKKLFLQSRTFMSFSSACSLAHWSVLLQLGYSLSAGIFYEWEKFYHSSNGKPLSIHHAVEGRKDVLWYCKVFCQSSVSGLLDFGRSGARNRFLCGPPRRSSILSLLFYCFQL